MADKISLIQYEFELEEETRYLIDPMDLNNFDWTNHVVDTYDKTGRCRIRLKNGEPRLSIKIPLFSRDTVKAKACIRIELKPQNAEQKAELLRMRDLILAEAGAQQAEKWGTSVKMSNGIKVWMNRNSANKWWIEVDKGVELLVPDSIKVIGTEKSGVRA